MPFSILQACLVASGVLFAVVGGWPQALVFCTFGGVLATREWLERHGAMAEQLKDATDKLTAKSEQLQALDAKVLQLNERMLRYETRPR